MNSTINMYARLAIEIEQFKSGLKVCGLDVEAISEHARQLYLETDIGIMDAYRMARDRATAER